MRHAVVRFIAINLTLLLAGSAHVVGLVPTVSPIGHAQAVRMDLAPTSLTVSPVALRWDEPITVEWTVENRGPDAIPEDAEWYDALYLSADSTLNVDQDEQIHSSWAAGPLPAGQGYTQTEEVALPVVPTGTYYLLIETDLIEYLPERDEGNNVFASQAMTISGVEIDLVPTTFTASATSATPGGLFSVTWTVVNEGATIPAEQQNGHGVIWFDEIYFSTNATLDDGDRRLSLTRASAATHEGPFEAGGSYTVTATVSVPVITAGPYYLLLVVNDSGSLWEDDETNNLVAGPQIVVDEIDIDLAPTAVTVSSTTVSWYQILTVTWTVANDGADAVPPRGGDERVVVGTDTRWRDALYLSNDSNLDAGDTRLTAEYAEGPVAAGGVYTVEKQIRLPALPEDDYVLLVSVDEHNRLLEHDEANNVLVGPTIMVSEVGIDLVPITVEIRPATIDRRGYITLVWTVINQGQSALPDGASWYDEVYLSADTMLGRGDQLIQSIGGWALPPFVGEGPLAAGDTYEGTLERVDFPAVPEGTWYLLVLVDAGDSLQETDESNNLLAVPIDVG